MPTLTFNNVITINIFTDNFLWKTKLFAYLRSQRIMDFIDGTIVQTLATITILGTNGTTTTTVPNPEFNIWYL
ncbi:hypothetical protein GUJ93_ZPchr0002g23494 [Zizania palustris]|uniref:Uncharacterized protein n=1 Tax=Zizania palustris TaxID=103762 RepID=A0A8J5RXD9_ZIZPA|nr:hypothetical protein GUJ93_ZPchr0002g23494 [Zizania palustris]